MDTRLERLATAAGTALVSACFAAGALAATGNADKSHQAWRAAIARAATPGKGCFTASYPLMLWRQVACVTAPNVPYIPATGARGGRTVGDGDDYAAVTKKLTSSAAGSFPSVRGLQTENDGGHPNVYSIQLNSNFMSNDKACDAASEPTKCLGWEQFVYSSSSHSAFIQYWLIHYTGGAVRCPAGWFSFSDDCYRNSNAVSAPQEKITDLAGMTLAGSAIKKGIDTLTFVDGANAYSTTGEDTVMYLAYGWHGSEFNIIGDGGGSEATFNAGTKLKVRIDLVDGSLAKPTCQPNAGTTGETNNLNLGTCKATKGSGTTVLPAVQFGESN